MSVVTVSEKGQITIPASLRKNIGIKFNSKVKISDESGRLIIEPLMSIKDLNGVLGKYAEGKSSDWQTIRETAMNNEFEDTDKKLTNDDTIGRVEKF